MPAFELAAIIVTGVVSLLDLCVNVVTACSSGRFKMRFCNCFVVEHNEDPPAQGITESEAELIATNAIRKASQPNNKSG